MKKTLLAFLAVVLGFVALGCGKVDEKPELESIISTFILEEVYYGADTVLTDKVQGYPITWTVSESDYAKVIEKDGAQVLDITQGETYSDAITLTATICGIEDPEVKVSKNFEIYVKPIPEYIECTIEDFNDNEKVPLNEKVKVSGTVYAHAPEKGFWVIDETGYTAYVYAKSDPVKDGYTLGSAVEVIGKKEIYYSMLEITSPEVTVVTKGDGTYDYSKIEQAISIDDLAAKNGDNRAEFGKVYNIEGYVIEDPNGSYTYAIKSHLTQASVVVYDSVITTEVIDSYKPLLGKYVSVKVLLWDHHSKGFIRVMPLSEVKETATPTLTDEEKFILVEEYVNSLAGDVSSDIELPTKLDGQDDVNITWKSSNEAVLTSAGERKEYSNKENIEVNLTATAKIGDVTKEYQVTVKVIPVLEENVANVVKAALAAGEASKYYIVKVKVLEYHYSGSDYFFIGDETGVTYVRTKAASVNVEKGKSYKMLIKTTVYYNSNKEVTPQLNVITCEELSEEVKVVEAEEVKIADLAKWAHTVGSSTMTSPEIKAVSSNAFFGKLVKVTCYISVRTSGSYTNVYLATENNTTSASAYYQHSSYYQDELKALDGKQVTIIAPLYGYHASYGWILGTYLSVEEVK